MSLKSRFLNLPIKEQICICILFLNLFSLLVILSLTCSFCYEAMKEDYNQKKVYFFNKFQEIIEASFYFQNFCLLQYEEIIKRMQKQIYKFHRNSTTNYNFNSNYKIDQTKDRVLYFNTDLHKEISKNNDLLFFFCYNKNKTICEYHRRLVKSKFDTLSSLIFSHDIHKSFRVPGYDLPILKNPIMVDVYVDLMFSFNGTRIYQEILDKKSNYTNFFSNFNIGNLHNYYEDKVKVMMTNAFAMFKYYFSGVLFNFHDMFGKANNEMETIEEVSIYNSKDNSTFFEYVKAVSGYYSSVKFPINQFSLISYGANKRFYYIEGAMIDDYLSFIHKRISDFLDIDFIPLYMENNTIISPELCIEFLLKQINYQLDRDKIIELYNNIKIGESNISSCFFDPKAFEKQYEINDVFIKNCSHFLTVNNRIYQGVLNVGEYTYYYIKYTYPNYNPLKEFKSEYLLLDQINFYLFASFKDPIMFSDYVYDIYENLFIMIVMIIIYTWVICLFINMIIFTKVIVQITEPINKLQKAIESTSIKDESIFIYEYDIFINDLFSTCKELLSGQIDNNNNEKGLGKFNILSIPKDKKIDQNIYERNLIINNDLMNRLMIEQQSMMDFSRNIQINGVSDFNIKKTKRSIDLGTNNFLNQSQSEEIIHEFEDNSKRNTLQNEVKNNINQNKINEEQEREPYKRLFQISEFLDLYQNKIENNYIHINNNIIKDESNKSKISNNLATSLKITSKIKKQLVKDDSSKREENENISINMLNNTNITYLWYMEAKKRKNKSINYYIGINYDELFADYNNYQINPEEFNKK